MIMANSFTQQAADAATKSADTAAKALEITEAADVALDSMQCTPHMSADTIVTLRFKNNGRTRADGVHVHWKYEIRGVPDIGLVGSSSETILAAGSVQESDAQQPLGAVVGTGRVGSILNGTLPLHISVQFSYRDKFSHPHEGSVILSYHPGTLCMFDVLSATSK
jgi:hypothetical protein